MRCIFWTKMHTIRGLTVVSGTSKKPRYSENRTNQGRVIPRPYCSTNETWQKQLWVFVYLIYGKFWAFRWVISSSITSYFWWVTPLSLSLLWLPRWGLTELYYCISGFISDCIHLRQGRLWKIAIFLIQSHEAESRWNLLTTSHTVCQTRKNSAKQKGTS